MPSESETDTYAPENRDFYRRQALAWFIRENAAAPRILAVEDPGKPIEDLSEDELWWPAPRRRGRRQQPSHHAAIGQLR